MTTSELSADVSVWNIASNLCSACLDGHYENCYCDDEEKLGKDISCDSLDENSDNEEGGGGVYMKEKGNNIYDEYISDDEFQDSDNRQLPPSTTDWESIDCVLEKELDMKDHDLDGGTQLSKRLAHNVNMQMVFLESEESDKASDPDVEVYYDDNSLEHSKTYSSFSDLSGGRDVSSRDSGYVTNDVMDVNIERVGDRKCRRSSVESVEESTRVLASLKVHEEHEEKVNGEIQLQKQKESDFIDEIHQKNVDELRTMKEFLELHIAKINIELLEQLEIRDYLYSHHESLLMDAEDAESKSNTVSNSNSNTPSTKSSQPKTPMSPTKSPAKRRSFWWR